MNFLKSANVRMNRQLNKELHIYFVIFLALITIAFAINIWQGYKLYVAKNILIIAKKDVEGLDAVSKENNIIKDEIKKLQRHLLESQNIMKSNDKILDFIISLANIIPDDVYLDAFSFKPAVKLGIDLPNIKKDNKKEPSEKEYGLGKIRLKGYTTSKSITDFLERLSRLEIVDNVRLVYLKYPDPGARPSLTAMAGTVAEGGVYTEPRRSSGQENESNLLEFSIKLMLN